MKVKVNVSHTDIAVEIECEAKPAKGDQINFFQDMTESQREEHGWIFTVESVTHTREETDTSYFLTVRLLK